MGSDQVSRRKRVALVGSLLVAIASLAVYISVLESQDDSYNSPWVLAYLAVMGAGIVGIAAILLGASRSLAIPVMSAYGVAGLLGLASFGILLLVVAGLLVPTVSSNNAQSVHER